MLVVFLKVTLPPFFFTPLANAADRGDWREGETEVNKNHN